MDVNVWSWMWSGGLPHERVVERCYEELEVNVWKWM
jgi:hypothetical protein